MKGKGERLGELTSVGPVRSESLISVGIPARRSMESIVC
jgi:hypothetical protein